MTENVKSIHKVLRELVQDPLPCITGSLSLSKAETKIFYNCSAASGSNGVVDFSAPNVEESLKALADACQPASFGVGGQDVLDESYRKAGKMDAEDFAAQFSPLNHDTFHIIREFLFKGNSDREIRFELYKLNVYGPGSFFKAHVDTPRSADMFGSLVVVLPTKHEGGTLLFRHGEKKWDFDSANLKAVEPSDPTSLRAGFAIFYSDVEHEITPIISGYRVSLTYNLYFGAPMTHVRIRDVTAVEVWSHLKALFEDDAFLPEGGLLGFKLVHKYPVSGIKLADTDLKSFLKGPDRSICGALNSLKVKTTLQIFYDMGYDRYEEVQLDYMFDQPLTGLLDESDYTAREFAQENDGIHVRHMTLEDCYKIDVLNTVEDSDPTGKEPSAIPVYWVTDTKSATQLSKSYLAYGNESSLDYFYGEIALVAHIGPKGPQRVPKSIRVVSTA